MVEKSHRLASEDRSKLLLKCAREIFVEKGFQKTNLDEIIALSGGSRRNIYEKFQNKQGLFYSAINDFYQEILNPINPTSYQNLGWKEHILAYAKDFFSHFYEESYFKFMKMVMRESVTNPELYKKYIEPNISIKKQLIANLLKIGQEQGEVRDDISCEELVEFMFSGIRGELFFQILLSDTDKDCNFNYFKTHMDNYVKFAIQGCAKNS